MKLHALEVDFVIQSGRLLENIWRRKNCLFNVQSDYIGWAFHHEVTFDIVSSDSCPYPV
jgi:hypothetical protein